MDMNGMLEIENANLRFLNFSGEKNDFNVEGNRNFNVIVPEDIAMQLMQDGVNVRCRESSDPDEPPIYTMKVNVSYRYTPPEVCIITSKGKKYLKEEDISQLDHIKMANVDLGVTFSYYKRNGRSGYSAYLAYIYVTVASTRVSEKYADLPTIE